MVLSSVPILLALACVALAGPCVFTERDALLVIDVQNDFMEETAIRTDWTPLYKIPEKMKTSGGTRLVRGSLAVNGSSEIIPVINDWTHELLHSRSIIMHSLDWHEPDHCSFCPSGGVCGPQSASDVAAGAHCIDPVSLADIRAGRYMQWPSHCIAREFGARFHPFMAVPTTAIVFKKGFNSSLDSYSAIDGGLSLETYPFDRYDPPSELHEQRSLAHTLAAHHIDRLFVAGLATDYCIRNSVLDILGKGAAALGITQPLVPKLYLLTDAVRGIDPASTAAAISEMAAAGAELLPGQKPLEALATICTPPLQAPPHADL
eukprot:m.8534 g.8534  ORF g.8534 m.8534 type:complete len:319 (-) comp2299_c0_seq2:119-1075(-)